MHSVPINRFNGARQKESRQTGFQKPGNQNLYGTKMQGKRVVGESIQTWSTTRNSIKHITRNNKEYTRLGITGGGVQKINKRHAESKTLNETYRIRHRHTSPQETDGVEQEPEQDQPRPKNTKLDSYQETERKQEIDRKHSELKISQSVDNIYTGE